MNKPDINLFYHAQERADELRRLIDSISKQAMDECTAAKFAAQKRQPRKYNGHIKKAAKHLLRLRRECQAAHVVWDDKK